MKPVCVVNNGCGYILGLLVYLMEKAASTPASRSTSCQTQEGSRDFDLIFDHEPEMDVELDVE